MIKYGTDKSLVGNVYRSPNSGDENNRAICTLVEEMCSYQQSQTVICGDFNMKEIDWDRHIVRAPQGSVGSLFLDCLDDNFLLQQGRGNTRFRDGQEPSLLDQIITKPMDNIVRLDYDAPLGKSDHVCIVFDMLWVTAESEDRRRRHYFKGNYDEIRRNLRQIDWKTELSDKDANEAWDILENYIVTNVERHIPLQRIQNKFRKKWPPVPCSP
ncbi:hypothetical protein Pcinc_032300 [Petrolisthes cinctipes]|uniref:Endonuclease/exonuclease/phosphatase domain-containing protein n=1 Tax=Petrolisthes cinctipes TaxID=88211 RepID=A0AAE1K3K6_PETCI|nr:hypothetical protein Pcinc_032300 [Petrolisthes cinctipes]